MDVSEHPAVTASHQLVLDYAEAIDQGKMPESMGLAFLASDLLGCSVELHHAGDLEASAHIVELAARFAWRRRMLHNGTAPDDLSGLDDPQPPAE